MDACAELHLNKGDAIIEITTSDQDKSKAISEQDKDKVTIFLMHHIYAGLNSEYLTVKGSLILWNLKERYDNKKVVTFPT